MKEVLLSKRLMAAATFARKGKRIADIGTDHASLPIYLIQNGISEHAIACDINIGPLSVARRNIFESGLKSKIETLLTDGLHGVETFCPDDIFILGMGGELISRIILNSDLHRCSEIRYILQPMTHAYDLRRDLAINGFCIDDEICVRDKDRIYQIIVAHYDGNEHNYSEVELWLGEINIKRNDQEVRELAKLYAIALQKKMDGYLKSGKDISEIEALIRNLIDISKKENSDESI